MHEVKQVDGYWRIADPPSIDELTNYYTTKYYKSRTPVPQQKLVNKDDKELRWLENNIWKDIRQLAGNHKTMLDYGAGTGEFARYMTKHGWDVFRYDLGEPLPDGKYPVITLMHVIEHVLDPDETLTQLHTMLEKNGTMIIVCPNDFSIMQHIVSRKFGKYWIAYPDHLSYFNPKSLRRLLKKHGFKNIRSTTDFPMELFLLLGYDYVFGSDGPSCHKMRVAFENVLPTSIRRVLYKALSLFGIGRNIIMVAQK